MRARFSSLILIAFLFASSAFAMIQGSSSPESSHMTSDRIEKSWERLELGNEPPTNPLSLAKATELLTSFKASEELAFNYPADGCYWRAHLMAFYLTSYGPVEKVWLTAPVFDPGPPINQQGEGWAFHVAPVVWVREESGQVVRRVMDPAFSDHPMTFQAWAGVQRASPDTHQFALTLPGKDDKNKIFLFSSTLVLPHSPENGGLSYEETLEMARKDLARIYKLAK